MSERINHDPIQIIELTEPQLSHLQNGDTNIYPGALLSETSEF